MNRERLAYLCLSLIGHRVTVKLRNHTYEGLFHSCALDGDFSVMLRFARQPAQGDSVSSEVIKSLIIPWKEIIEVSAVGVTSPIHEATRFKRGGFQTDTEISAAANIGSGRELVQWQPDASAGDVALEGSIESVPHREGTWDQFAANSERYGITSTYSDELYTTKLDPSAVSKEKREKAERIAREIEGGVQHSAAEERCLGGEEDEEALFSSVPRAQSGKELLMVLKGNTDSGGASSSQSRVSRSNTDSLREVSKGLPQAALTSDNLTRHDSGLGSGDFALEHRTKRGLITANSMRPPMVSEMKRINALNLEPALPKLDDKTRTDWINFKQQQTRNPSKPSQGASLKQEFEASIAALRQYDAAKAQRSEAEANSGAKSSGAGPTIDVAAAGAELADTPSRSDFKFNASAKEFTFNSGAAPFTPGGSGGSGNQPPTPMGNQASAARSPNAAASTSDQPAFPPARQARQGKTMRALSDVLHGVFQKAKTERPESVTSAWPEAERGPLFREVLGRPNAQGAPGGGPGGPCQGGCMMQTPAQMAAQGGNPGQGQQMTGYIVQTPGGPGGTSQQQVVYGSPGMMMGPGGASQRMQGQGAQQPQQQQPQQGQQAGCFGQQQAGAGMPNQPQAVMMPAGMVAANNQMGAMPKFGQMVPVMMQGGQMMAPQGMMQGPQGQMMVMQPGQMMQGFNPQQRQMGGGGMQNQSQGDHS